MSDNFSAFHELAETLPDSDQDQMAQLMAIELRERELEREARIVEEDASRLEAYIRAGALAPQKLMEERSQLEQEALAIRDRRELILETRKQLEQQRQALMTLPVPGTSEPPTKEGTTSQAEKPEPPTLEETTPAEVIRLQVEVSANSEHTFWAGLTQDIDEGGLFIATHEILPLGTQIDLRLTLAGHDPMQLAAEVRWLREHSEFTAEFTPGLGVAFIDLPDEPRQAILDFFRRRPPLLYE